MKKYPPELKERAVRCGARSRPAVALVVAVGRAPVSASARYPVRRCVAGCSVPKSMVVVGPGRPPTTRRA